MTDLHALLNWRLLKGSHRFPGPDGGTCINEAAAVVAGLKYRAIRGVFNCPPCFSIPISAYAIRLNDAMDDQLRQELLLPFVTRLAGSADTPAIERQRADLLVICTVRDILPIVLRLHRLERCAVLCESVATRAEARIAATKSREELLAAVTAAYAATAANAANAAANAADAAYAAANAAAYAANAADAYAAVTAAYAARRDIWTKAAAILDAALCIGRQAEPIEAAIIMARAEQAKEMAA